MGLARATVKVAAAAFDRVRRPQRGLVVLLYHRVGRRTSIEVDLPRALFVDQMAALADSGRLVDLDGGLARLADPTPPGDTLVTVTFDDGTADFADAALPVLAAHGVPVTLYVATDFVERGVTFPHDGAPLTWTALRDAMSTGLVGIGSHTHTHALLDKVPLAQAEAELDRSVGLVEDRLGVEVPHFAYPKAVAGPAAIDALVRARFRSAALAGTRANPYGATDPYRLARSPVQLTDGMRWFRHKAEGGMGFEEAVRRLVNRGRYAGATT